MAPMSEDEDYVGTRLGTTFEGFGEFGIDLFLPAEGPSLGLRESAPPDYEDLETHKARVPATVRLMASGVCPTPTAPFALNFDGPSAGFFWIVRRLIVGGEHWSTTAAGSAEVYVSGMGSLTGTMTQGPQSIAGASSLADLVDQTSTLPAKGFYPAQQVVVLASENLSMVIQSGTAGQLYVASALVQVVRFTADLEAGISV